MLRRLIAGAFVLSATVLAVPATSHAAAPTVRCTADNSTITANEVNRRQTIVVEAGVNCVVDGVTAKAIRSAGAASLRVVDSDFVRNVMVRNTVGNVRIGDKGCNFDPRVGNNLKVSNTGGNVAVCFMQTKNNITVRNTAGRVGVFQNCAGNNLTVAGTASTARVRNNRFENNLHFRNNADLRERGNTKVARGTC